MHRRRFLIGGCGVAFAGVGATYAGARQMGSMKEYNASVAAIRAPLSQYPEVVDILRFATLAANGHNTQPWRFRIGEDRIEILPDLARRTPVVDPDDHHLFVNLGCAAENLSLASGARNRPGELSFNPTDDGSVVFAVGGEAVSEPALFDAILRRQSTRADYDGSPVSAADLRTLAAAAVIPGVDLVLITERTQMDRVRDLIIAGNNAQRADLAFVRELKSWLRFSPRQALESGDGLFSASTGNPILPAWIGSRMFDWVLSADAENDKYARQLRTSAGVAVFVSERSDKDHWVRVELSAAPFSDDNSAELEFESNFYWLTESMSRGWLSSHFDVVDQFSPAGRPSASSAYTHKLDFELDTALRIFKGLPEGRWLRGVEFETSLDYLASGIPKKGDVFADGTRFVDDASHWSFSFVIVIPVAPF